MRYTPFDRLKKIVVAFELLARKKKGETEKREQFSPPASIILSLIKSGTVAEKGYLFSYTIDRNPTLASSRYIRYGAAENR